jgi:uncharacterized protein (TIGR03435 family)
MRISLPATIAVSAICAVIPLIGADQPKFEAASVKRTDRCSLDNSADAGMIAFKGDPLKAVLMEAFKVKMDQIVGPSWLDADCFDIFARIPEGATRDQVPAMLQALLAERFKLAAHKEDRPRPGYALAIDKSGPKFKESVPGSELKGVHSGQVRFGAAPAASGIKGSMTMASLARFLSIRLGAPVQDLTGLKGTYDIDLTWTPDRSFEPMGQFAAAYSTAHPGLADGGAGLPPAPTADIFTAIRDSLGLRLEPRKQPVEVLVIDHIERVPTGN